MDMPVSEVTFPLHFRSHNAKSLGEHLQHRHNVQMVGMKRVGISNFLRFFLYHTGVKSQYLPREGKNLFIPIDLNNLIEREIFPFWRLAFKRIVDAVESSILDNRIKERISHLFLSSIQSGDLFLTFDGIRESLVELTKAHIFPTIFLLRFDRLKNAVTPEFFSNLQSLQDATNQKLSFVFTSFRELDSLSPIVFSKRNIASFTNTMYLQPADRKDTEIQFTAIASKYNLSVPFALKDLIIDLSGGHTQYLQLSVIILHELSQKKKIPSREDVITAIESDERIMLQSEELWESLNHEEQEIVKRVNEGKKISESDRELGKYLWHCGFLIEKNNIINLFSPLFALFVEKSKKRSLSRSQIVEFSKKEHMLFELLKKHINTICEREKIVELVWPEYKEYGVSDWSVDRLVARVRGKLKKQKSPYEISTVRTRGYKLLQRSI